MGLPRARCRLGHGIPAEIGFMPVDGLGPHRIWYTGGRYAYASIHFPDFTDHILAVIDMSNRSEERRVGKECRSRWSPYHKKKKHKHPTSTQYRLIVALDH